MSSRFDQMWTELGLDLEAHAALLQVLGKAYKDIYLSQPNRPAAMDYFNFVVSEVHGQRIKELLDGKKDGHKVVGAYCVFAPEELVIAADAVLVGLCAGAEFAFDEVDKLLPRATCSLIKSAFGFKLGKVCPYLESADMVVGENTCDGKKKSYELLKDLVSNFYVLDLPQVKSDKGRDLLRAEYERFKKALEDLSGVTIDLKQLKRGVEKVNKKRKAIHRLCQLRNASPLPISGLDALLINQISFYDEPQRFTDAVNKLCDELDRRVSEKRGIASEKAPRILISGCPMAVPNWKLPWIVESSGAVIVAEESCVGERGSRNLVDESAQTLDGLMESILDRYFQVDCAVFTPNPDRLEHIKQMYSEYRADGVIHYGLQFCQPYQIESLPVEKALEESGIPTLRIDTDYSMEDVEQIKTRVEAFLERIGSSRCGKEPASSR
jgi:benzoyl-CoA reductase/2-hydroxyglutaryl-CoA dehydratase subunit BcrC/BadD/HgdB